MYSSSNHRNLDMSLKSLSRLLFLYFITVEKRNSWQQLQIIGSYNPLYNGDINPKWYTLIHIILHPQAKTTPLVYNVLYHYAADQWSSLTWHLLLLFRTEFITLYPSDYNKPLGNSTDVQIKIENALIPMVHVSGQIVYLLT